MKVDIEWLIAVEEIKALKAKYFRYMDTKNWQGLSECFSEDLDADFREAPGSKTSDRSEYMAIIQHALQDARTVHHGHMPEITIHDQSSASGIWAMEDIVELPGMNLQGWGHYHEEYRKEKDGWVISRIRLSRLRLNINET